MVQAIKEKMPPENGIKILDYAHKKSKGLIQSY
jgi:hypothetical protein